MWQVVNFVFLVLDGILKLHLKIDLFIIDFQNWPSYYAMPHFDVVINIGIVFIQTNSLTLH